MADFIDDTAPAAAASSTTAASLRLSPPPGARAYDAKPLPPPRPARDRVVARAAAIADVPPSDILADARHGLQPATAAFYEAAVRSAAGAPPDAAALPPVVAAELVEYSRAADEIVGHDASLPINPNAALELAGWNPFKRARRVAKATVRSVTHPVRTARKTGRAIERGSGLIEDSARATLRSTYRVGRFVFARAAKPGATWDAASKRVARLPGRARDIGAKSLAAMMKIASMDPEEIMRMVVRVSLKPLLQVMVQFARVAGKQFVPETLAIGGGAALARLAGAGVALDFRKLRVAQQLADIGAKRIARRIVGQLPEPPNVGPLKARNLWRKRIRGPVTAALARALSAVVVALGTGKGEDAIAIIAGAGALSWASVSIKKLLDFLVAEALSAASALALSASQGAVEKSLASIGIGSAITREALAALRSPFPSGAFARATEALHDHAACHHDDVLTDAAA